MYRLGLLVPAPTTPFPFINNPNRETLYQVLYRGTGILMLLVPVLAIALHLSGLPSMVLWVELSGVGVFILYWSIKNWELSAYQLPAPNPLPAPAPPGPTVQGI